MRTGRPKKPLAVKLADQEKLELLARRPKTALEELQSAREEGRKY